MLKFKIPLLFFLLVYQITVYADGTSFDLCQLAESTGGTCVPLFVDENQQGEGSLYQQQITDIVTRELINTIQPTITQAKPAQISRGTTIDITVTAPKAHFNANTKIDLDTGIILNRTIYLSATQYILNVTVKDSVALNSTHDITMTSILADGTEEVVKGEGILQVIKGSNTPKILSITPTNINRDAAVTMQIIGENTHFTEDSKIQFWRAVGDKIEFDDNIETYIRVVSLYKPIS